MTSESQPTQANRRRYVKAFQKVTVDTGTPYPCSKEDIKILTAEKSRFWRFEDNMLGGVMSAEEATLQLERGLLPGTVISDSAIDALERLRKMVLLEDTDWGPDLVVKTLHDWDKLFFHGRLRGYVRIKWVDQDYFGKGNVVGRCDSDERKWRWGQCEIAMNADELLLFGVSYVRHSEEDPPLSQFRYIWCVVLHELCHAYLTVLTGFEEWDTDDYEDGYDGAHGKHFQRCIYAVDQSARQLLGLCTDGVGYSGTGDRRPRFIDVKNRVVEPETSRWRELKSQAYYRVVQRCRHSVRWMILRNKGYLHSWEFVHTPPSCCL